MCSAKSFSVLWEWEQLPMHVVLADILKVMERIQAALYLTVRLMLHYAKKHEKTNAKNTDYIEQHLNGNRESPQGNRVTIRKTIHT